MRDLVKSLTVPQPYPSATCACFGRLQYQAGCSELRHQNILTIPHVLDVNFQLLLEIDIHLVGCRNHADALESKDTRSDHLSLLQRERATATEAVCTVRQGRDRALVSAGQGNNIYDTTKGSKSTDPRFGPALDGARRLLNPLMGAAGRAAAMASPADKSASGLDIWNIGVSSRSDRRVNRFYSKRFLKSRNIAVCRKPHAFPR
jgi:hypothetical protein